MEIICISLEFTVFAGFSQRFQCHVAWSTTTRYLTILREPDSKDLWAMIAMILDSALFFCLKLFLILLAFFPARWQKISDNRSRSDFQPSGSDDTSALCDHFQCHHQPQDIATHWCINSSSLGESGCSTQRGKAKQPRMGRRQLLMESDYSLLSRARQTYWSNEKIYQKSIEYHTNEHIWNAMKPKDVKPSRNSLLLWPA